MGPSKRSDHAIRASEPRLLSTLATLYRRKNKFADICGVELHGVRHLTEEKQTLTQVGHIISDETKSMARKV